MCIRDRYTLLLRTVYFCCSVCDRLFAWTIFSFTFAIYLYFYFAHWTLFGGGHAPLGKTQRFYMVQATPPLGKHKDSMWWGTHTPWENMSILYGEGHTPSGKTQRFCVVRATHLFGTHKGFRENSRLITGECRTPRGKTHRFSVVRATRP